MKLTKDNISDVYKSELKDIRKTARKYGLRYLENCFVDSSGFGQDNEPAMTKKQFEKRITELLSEHKVIYTYITNAGQFQVNVGVYLKINEEIKL